MKLICLGDSLTYGYGVPRKKTWVHLLGESLKAEVINAGISGDTTGGMLTRFQRDVIDQGGSHVFLMGGANDILLSGTDAAARANLGAMVYRSMAEGIVPILGLPTPHHPSVADHAWGQVFDFTQTAPVMAALNDWLLRFSAGFGISAVDFRDIFGVPPQGAYYLDGLHVTALGHQRMAERFLSSGLFPHSQAELHRSMH